MNNQDFLLQLCSRLDNQSLETLSHTSLWTSIRLFARDQHFWHLRVEHLLGRELKQRLGDVDWKRVYYLLLSALREKNPYTNRVLADELTVDILLEVYDPSADNNCAIQLSCRVGYTWTVKLLLEDGRADPSVGNNWPIGQASSSGHIGLVKLLLSDPRVDPSADNNYAIKQASWYGHTEVVKLLLGDPRVDPSAGDNYAIGHSSAGGYIEVVKLLLADPRVNPSANNNFAIGWARRRRHAEVIKLLEQDRRVDPNRIFF